MQSMIRMKLRIENWEIALSLSALRDTAILHFPFRLVLFQVLKKLLPPSPND